MFAWHYRFSLSRASKQTPNDKITSSFEDNDVTLTDCALAPSPRNSSVSVIPVQIKTNNSLNNERCFRSKVGGGVTRRPSGFNVIDDPRVPLLSLVYLWISSSSVTRRMEREGKKAASGKKIPSNDGKLKVSLVLSWNCNAKSFDRWKIRLLSMSVIYRFSMTHCWNSTGKREGGKSSLNVNDNLASIRARILGELSRALYLEISLSKD